MYLHPGERGRQDEQGGLWEMTVYGFLQQVSDSTRRFSRVGEKGRRGSVCIFATVNVVMVT